MGDDPVRVLRGDAHAPLALLCEHASNRLPEDYSWHREDAWLAESHWAWDIGARVFTEELARAFGAPAVLANFSRLLADPNRPESSDQLIRNTADGAPVRLNHAITREERQQRVRRFYQPYHDAAADLAHGSKGSVLLSVHTYTPVYEGQPRQLEVGVLWDRADDLNEQLAAVLERFGFLVGRNQPYSGKEGLAYSVERHAEQAGLDAVEIEVRQDLCVDPAFRGRLLAAMTVFLASVGDGR